jgi:exopolyphosphatase/guanosine-5'-triphosphate,3'-diphosphate pyrophosphatase
MAQINPRFGQGGDDRLFQWTSPLFPKEPPPRRRLRNAAALLGDIAWDEHPDYRADQALRHVLFMPVTGIDHTERVFLAAALYARYGGNSTGEPPAPFRLLDEEMLAAARLTGLALRLGYTLSGGVPDLLAGSELALSETAVVLTLPAESAGRFGESVQRRLDAVARALGRRSEVRRL